jgi:hypothetical protein
MGLKSLSEAIILQSIEDLWNPAYRHDSIEFLKGEGLQISAGLAGMSALDHIRLLRMLNGLSAKKTKHSKTFRKAAV